MALHKNMEEQYKTVFVVIRGAFVGAMYVILNAGNM